MNRLASWTATAALAAALAGLHPALPAHAQEGQIEREELPPLLLDPGQIEEPIQTDPDADQFDAPVPGEPDQVPEQAPGDLLPPEEPQPEPGQDLPPAQPDGAEGASPSIEEIQPTPQKQETRVKSPVAEFAGLDKITGRTITFDVYINETVQFGALQVTPKVCYSRPDAEEPKTDSFVEVDEITLDRKIRRIFTGWMFAESPGISAVEHPVYDVWLKSCRQKSDVPPPETAKTN